MKAQALVPHMRYMYNLALKHLNHVDDAQDAVQDAVVKWMSSRDVRYLYNPKGWFGKIVWSVCMDFLKRQKRKRLFEHDRIRVAPCGMVKYLPGSCDSESIDVAEPDHFGLEEDALEHLTQAVDSLKEKYRTPLVMHCLGWKYEEIAKSMDIPLGTVRSRIWYAKEHLRSRLDRSLFV
jgi:RNA polymerase sigma-70 factor (ECF subfamily)